MKYVSCVDGGKLSELHLLRCFYKMTCFDIELADVVIAIKVVKI